MPSGGSHLSVNQVGQAVKQYSAGGQTSLYGCRQGQYGKQTAVSEFSIATSLYKYPRMTWYDRGAKKVWGPSNSGPSAINIDYNTTIDIEFLPTSAGQRWWSQVGDRWNNWTWSGESSLRMENNWGYKTRWRNTNTAVGTKKTDGRVYGKYADHNLNNHASQFNTWLHSAPLYLRGKSLHGVEIYTVGETKWYPYYGNHNDGYVRFKGLPGLLPATTTFRYSLQDYGQQYGSANQYVYFRGINSGSGTGGSGRYFSYTVHNNNDNSLVRSGNLWVYYGSNGAVNTYGSTWSTTLNVVNP